MATTTYRFSSASARSIRAEGHRFRRATAAVLSLLVLLGTVVAEPFAPPAAQADDVGVTLAISGDARILAGEDGVLRLAATGSGDWGYNLAFVVSVPVGLEPRGSTVGPPRIIDDPDDAGRELWIFEDVSDLPAGGTSDITVDVRPAQPAPGSGETSDPQIFPVGSVIDVTASAFTSANPNLLPWFTGSSAINQADSEAATVSGDDAFQIEVAALRVTKSEPSPESELLRGVHDHTTVTTVVVENTSKGDTQAAVLVDYLAAGLEFLGCGGVDNTTADRAGEGDTDEYPGSGDLTGTPVLPAMEPFDAGRRDGCLDPVEVVTVVDDPDAPSDAVYTRVTWDLGTLPAGSETTLRYAAGIPLYENTVDFDGEGEPTGASLGQIANLDNNNGRPTRQRGGFDPAGDGIVYDNLAEATGAYQGIVRTGTDRQVSDEDDEFVHAMDLAVLKSVNDPDEFVTSDIATYTLRLRTGEYTSADQIVLTDTIPNGLCPLVPADTTVTGAPLPDGCEPYDRGLEITGATVEGVTYDASTGEFTLVLIPDAQPMLASQEREITYPVLMRADYTDSQQTGPTTSLDTFDNTVTVIGETTSIPPLVDWFPAVEQVWDDSAAPLPTAPTSITKRVAPRDSVSEDPADADAPCSVGDVYTDVEQPGFRLGDIACFELTVTFPSTVKTRNAVVTDVLPIGLLDYRGWVAVDGYTRVDGPDETAVFSQEGRRLEWELGAVGAGGDRFVPAGTEVRLLVWAEVVEPAAGPEVDKPENLMKYRQENVDGDVFFLRDEAAIEVQPGVSLLKGVQDVDGDSERAASSSDDDDGEVFNSNRDGIEVVQGESVTYRIDLTAPDVAIDDLVVWDSLPAGIACADVDDTDPSWYFCLDPVDAGFPGGLDGVHQDRSVLIWIGVSLDANDTTTLLSTVTVPGDASVSAVYDNTASIISYTGDTNTGGRTTYYPEDSLDTSRGDDWNAPGETARDESSVYLPDAEVEKRATTELGPDDDPNNGVGQAVTGELITFTYGVTIPANTTVYNGVLRDELPTGLALFDVVGATRDGGSVPAGFLLQDDLSETSPTPGTLTFPATYRNDTGADQVFEVTVRAYVSSGHDLDHGDDVQNTATFSSNATLDGDPLPDRNDRAEVEYIEPNPTVAKAVAAVNGEDPQDTPPVVAPGDTVDYTLTVANAGGRPISYDTVVTDCVPEGLTFVAYGASPDGVTPEASSSGDGDNGCPTDTTRLRWVIDEVAAGSSVELSYAVTVDPDAGGRDTYVNTADLLGFTLPSGSESGDRGEVEDDTAAEVGIVGAAIVKAVDPGAATIGEEVDYTVEVTLPADVNFYAASITDVVPAGIAVSATDCEPSDSSITCSGPVPAISEGSTSAELVWSFGDIGSRPSPPRTITITYTGTVVDTEDSTPTRPDPKAGDELENTATFAWSATHDGDPDQAVSDDAEVTVLEPDLIITKLVDGQPSSDVEPAEVFTYTVEVENVGTSTAHEVTITDEVPDGVVVDGATITGGGTLTGEDTVTGGGTITWTIAAIDVGSGQAVTLSYAASLAPSATLDGEGLVNTATVDAYHSLPDDAPDRRRYTGPDDLAEVTPAFPELSMVKSLPDGVVTYIDGPLLWQLTITNDGAGRAYALQVEDSLPPNWEYVAGSTVVGGVGSTGTDPDVATAGGVQTLRWSAAQLAGLDRAELPPGEWLTITFLATPTAGVVADPGVGSDLAHTNNATVTGQDGSGADRNANGPYADTDDANARIDQADLVIEKTTGDDAVAGRNLTWTLTVTNDGPDTAVGPFTVTDTLPEGVDFVSATGDGWDCGVPDSEGALTCVRAGSGNTLLDGASFPDIAVTVAIPADTAQGTPFTNLATVTGRTYDPDVDDPHGTNVDDSTVTVSTLADLVLDKALSGELVAGADATYTMSVRNDGPSVARGPIIVTDVVPEGTTFVSADGDGWDCNEGGGTITCTLVDDALVPIDLGVDEVAPQIDLVVAVDRARLDAVVNTAEVDGVSVDPDPDNNRDTVTTIPQTSADLAIEKARDGDIVAGEDVTYRITVTNHGPSDAVGVVVTDEVPDGLSFLGAAGTGWDCTQAGGTVTCTLQATLSAAAPDNERVLELTFSVSSSVGLDDEQIANTARVSSDTPDPIDGNNEDTDDSEVDGLADLSVTKSHEAPALAGGEVTFDLVVVNGGPSDAAAPVIITDVLPDDLSFVEASAGGWDCDEDDGTVTCTLVGADEQPVALAAGATAPALQIIASIDPSAGPATLINTVSVDSPTNDPVPGNNTDTDDVVVGIEADLAVVKTTVGADPVRAGERTSFEVRVTNLGPSTATAVRVVDELPPGVSLVTVAGEGWDCVQTSGLTLRCDRAELLPGTASAISVEVEVDPSVPDGTVLTNAAVVSSTTPDPNEGNDEDTSTVVVDAEADLVLTKSGPSSAPAGSQFLFSLVLTNDGPSDAIAPVRIVDQLPAGLTFVSATGPWDCEAGAVTGDGQELTCLLDGGEALLPAGATAPTLQVRALVTGSAGETLVNVASADSPTVDPDPDRAEDDAAVEVVELADLSVSKSHEGPVQVGDRVTFEVQVDNDGPSVARGVQVVDVVPDALPVVGAAGDGWSCTLEGQQVTCDLDGPLASGASADPILIEVEVTAQAYPTVDNTVVVSATTPESNEDNNTDTDNVTVMPEADLSLEKITVGADPVLAGEETSFEVRVTNAGPSIAADVSVVDTLPDGVEFVSVSGTGWDCDDSTVPTLRCERAQMLPGDAPVITVEVRVLEEVESGTVLTNTAVVSSTTPDPNPDDNQDTSTVTVDAEADLVLTKSGPGTARAGSEVGFDLELSNHGPSDAAAPIRIVDRLPAGMTYLSAMEPWDCLAGEATEEGQKVTCLLEAGTARLPAGATAPLLSLEVLVDPALEAGEVTNRARADSPTVDPDPDRAEDDAAVEVVELADLVVAKSHAGPAQVGDRVTFRVQVDNDGPSVARGVQVVDVVPDALPVVGAAGDGWACTVEGQQVTCDLDGPLASGASASPILIEVEVKAAAYPTVDNTAVVSSTTPESNEDNNTDTDTVTVPAVDLAIVKSHQGLFVVGQQGTFTLEVANLGPAPDPGPITVVDVLPPGLEPLTATGEGWECDLDAVTVTCVREDGLEDGATTSIELVVLIAPEAAPGVVNEATVASDAMDTDPSNDRDSDEVAVIPVSVLDATKEAVAEEDGALVWEIRVTNQGPNVTSEPIVVVDELVDELTLRSTAGDGWTCEVYGQVVTCSYLDFLPVGEEAVLTLVTSVDAPPGTRITNGIRVAGGSEDIDVLGVADAAGSGSDGGSDAGSDGGSRPGTGGGSHAGDEIVSEADAVVGQLARTGGSVRWLLAMGLGLAGVGAALVRHRRSGHDTG